MVMVGCFSWAVMKAAVLSLCEGLLKPLHACKLWDFSLLVFLEVTKRWLTDVFWHSLNL